MTKGDVTAAFTAATASPADDHYVLRLFVVGSTPRTAASVAQVRRICDLRLRGRYDLEVIDLHQDTSRATADDIIATPTLVKQMPLPVQRAIGDLADEERVLVFLGIDPAGRSAKDPGDGD